MTTDMHTLGITGIGHSRGRLATVVLWILQIAAAAMFLMAGSMKLAGNPLMVQEFGVIGLGQWFRYSTGLLEVGAGIGLLLSRFAFYAAVLLAVVMAGAFIAHVTVLGTSPAAPVVLFVVTGIIAYLRKS